MALCYWYWYFVLNSSISIFYALFINNNKQKQFVALQGCSPVFTHPLCPHSPLGTQREGGQLATMNAPLFTPQMRQLFSLFNGSLVLTGCVCDFLAVGL